MTDRPCSIVLVVVDSLRARSLRSDGLARPATPFLDSLNSTGLSFGRAYATECWTLPTHLSMFTGRLPSEHGAHFGTMRYEGRMPTIAEQLRDLGWWTEVVSRNAIFDGTLPGVLRGFTTNTRLLAPRTRRVDVVSVLEVLGKPRARRMLRESGFFGARQQAQLIHDLARICIPADELVLNHTLDRMAELRKTRRPYFLFLNLYDVHAPYAPRADSPLRPLTSLSGIAENVSMPWIMAKLVSHGYLKAGFRMSDASRDRLRARYHAAIELMDAKLERFVRSAEAEGLLDDTVLVITSDHGEAFGEHGLYLHDASAWDVHLHVPLWIRHPGVAPGQVDDIVSTASLFDLFMAVGRRRPPESTVLDLAWRRSHAVALAEHFHYRGSADLLPRYRHDQAAAIVGTQKAIVGGTGLHVYDLADDPYETAPRATGLSEFVERCRRDGAAAEVVERATAHLKHWLAGAEQHENFRAGGTFESVT